MAKDESLKTRNQKNFEFEHSAAPNFPKKNLLIELSNICNDRCIFCANKKMHRKKGYMDLNFLSSILKQAFDNGTREVGFYATGEPLIYPKLKEAIEIAKNIGYIYIYIYITSNGALLTEEKMVEVVNAGIDSIKLSINAYDKKSYKLIHGKDDFETVINNLIRLWKYRKEKNLNFKIYISFVVTKFTQDKIDYFKETYSKYCDDIAFYKVGNQAGMSSEINPYLICDSQNANIMPLPEKALPCHRLFNSITVTYEGYMSACCVDFENQLIIADLNKTSLKDAWNCEKFIKLRQSHLDGNAKGTMCQNCFSYSKERFNPLSPQYATPIDFDTFFSDEDIIRRIKEYNN